MFPVGWYYFADQIQDDTCLILIAKSNCRQIHHWIIPSAIIGQPKRHLTMRVVGSFAINDVQSMPHNQLRQLVATYKSIGQISFNRIRDKLFTMMQSRLNVFQFTFSGLLMSPK